MHAPGGRSFCQPWAINNSLHSNEQDKEAVFWIRPHLMLSNQCSEMKPFNECQQMPILYQLRQLRSKFDRLSTYTIYKPFILTTNSYVSGPCLLKMVQP
ncbi:hypothetical protein BD770DRAFT_401366 [Pilaira anomala]|nr:hypothetical protein BD770DRAFT_401366 [Pilaira anomala]